MACSDQLFPEKVSKNVALETSTVMGDEPIPTRLQLTKSTRHANLRDSTLFEIEFSGGYGTEVIVRETKVVKGRDVFKRHRGRLGTIVVVVRRPGCFFCREQALSFTCLAAQKQLGADFEIFGIVKETGIDDEGLVEFHQKYFPYPLYADKSFSFYNALGDRKVKMGFAFSRSSIVSMACETYYRWTQSANTIGQTYKGEGLVQGGVIFLDKNGKPLYAYKEETGQPFPVKDIIITRNVIANRRASSSS